ncbi:MAG: hypothetical protein AAB444_01240 [Patescibacteria group bacterium]
MTWRSRDHCSLSETAIEERVARALKFELERHGTLPHGVEVEIISTMEDTRSRHYFGGGPGEVPHQFNAVYHVQYKLHGE